VRLAVRFTPARIARISQYTRARMNAPAPNPYGPWACIDCGHRQADEGPCERCRESPLLDLRVPNVRLQLSQNDEDRATKHVNRLTTIAIPFGIVLSVFMGWLSDRWYTIAFAFFGLGFCAECVACTLLIRLGLTRIFPFQRRWSDLPM
jgi:hypothetical protein